MVVKVQGEVLNVGVVLNVGEVLNVGSSVNVSTLNVVPEGSNLNVVVVSALSVLSAVCFCAVVTVV